MSVSGLFLFEAILDFSLKCFVFQTIRPVVSRKKPMFSALFSTAKCPMLRGTVAARKASAFLDRFILPNKARWGKDGGPGGKETPLAR